MHSAGKKQISDTLYIRNVFPIWNSSRICRKRALAHSIVKPLISRVFDLNNKREILWKRKMTIWWKKTSVVQHHVERWAKNKIYSWWQKCTRCTSSKRRESSHMRLDSVISVYVSNNSIISVIQLVNSRKNSIHPKIPERRITTTRGFPYEWCNLVSW